MASLTSAQSLSSLAPVTTAITALSNLLLVSPQKTVGYQPQNPPNIDGSVSTAALPPTIVFHYEGEQSVALESDITDHFVEDNTAINDQIALKPEMISTHGFIGELNDIFPLTLPNNINIPNKLTIISAYAPALSVSALLAYNEAFQVAQIAQSVINTANSAVSSIGGTNGENVIGSGGLQNGAFNPATGKVSGQQNKQQVYFQQFYGYWRSRTLFTVQTPWAVFQNMAIKTLRAIQDAETNVITDFEITFKIIRTAQSSTFSPTASGRAAQESAALSDLGSSSGSVAGPALTAGISGMGIGVA